MANPDLSLIEEFNKETFELLTQMGDACGRLNSGPSDEAQLATIDRALHTLKGNSAALGFEDLAHVAECLLGRWRQKPNDSLAVIWRFLSDCRRYVILVGNARKPQSGFFDKLLSPEELALKRRPARPAATTAAQPPMEPRPQPPLSSPSKAPTSAATEVPVKSPPAARQPKAEAKKPAEPSKAAPKAPSRPNQGITLIADEPSIDEILASVPVLNPDISELVAKAAEHLRLTGGSVAAAAPQSGSSATGDKASTQSKPEPEPEAKSEVESEAKQAPKPEPKPAAKSEPTPDATNAAEAKAEEPSPAKAPHSVAEDLSALRSHDISRQLQSLRRRLASSHVEAPELECALEFLEQLQESPTSRRREPLQQFLQGAVADVAALGEQVDRKLSGTVLAHEIQILAPLGDLIRYQLTEILRGRLCEGRIETLDAKVDYTVEAEADADQLLIVLRGLGQRPRTSALDRLRLQNSMDFVQDLNGSLRHGDQVGELELCLDIGSVFCSEVCLVETADARFYLPAASVATSGDLHPGATEIIVRTSSGPRRLPLHSMEEKESLLVAAASDELAAEGLLGHCLSLRRSERIPLLDPDSL